MDYKELNANGLIVDPQVIDVPGVDETTQKLEYGVKQFDPNTGVEVASIEVSETKDQIEFKIAQIDVQIANLEKQKIGEQDKLILFT